MALALEKSTDSEDGLWGLILSDAEREADSITVDRIGRVGERRNFYISDAKMKSPVPNRSWVAEELARFRYLRRQSPLWSRNGLEKINGDLIEADFWARTFSEPVIRELHATGFATDDSGHDRSFALQFSF